MWGACQGLAYPNHEASCKPPLGRLLQSVGSHNAVAAHNQIGSTNMTLNCSDSPLYCLARPCLITRLWDIHTYSTDYQGLTWDMVICVLNLVMDSLFPQIQQHHPSVANLICAVLGPIGDPETNTNPEGRIPKCQDKLHGTFTSLHAVRECNQCLVSKISHIPFPVCVVPPSNGAAQPRTG